MFCHEFPSPETGIRGEHFRQTPAEMSRNIGNLERDQPLRASDRSFDTPARGT